MNNNPLVKSLMTSLQGKNPQGYVFASQLIQNGGNIDPIVKQLLGKVTPEQKQQILNTAKGYGVPDDYLSKLQNMK